MGNHIPTRYVQRVEEDRIGSLSKTNKLFSQTHWGIMFGEGLAGTDTGTDTSGIVDIDHDGSRDS